MKRIIIGTLIALLLVACTPTRGEVTRKYQVATGSRIQHWLEVTQVVVDDPIRNIMVSEADWNACNVGDHWPSCRVSDD